MEYSRQTHLLGQVTKRPIGGKQSSKEDNSAVEGTKTDNRNIIYGLIVMKILCLPFLIE